MCLVMVNEIRAYKKLVLFTKFIESSARQISESKGMFEVLPESCQSCSMNLCYSSDTLVHSDLRQLGNQIKEYFKFSPLFFNMRSNNTLVDPELKKHCDSVKVQKVTPKALAEYYLAYMDRMGKESDPRVSEKLKNKKYEDFLPTPVVLEQFAGPAQYGQPGAPNQLPCMPMQQPGQRMGFSPQAPMPIQGGYQVQGPVYNNQQMMQPVNPPNTNPFDTPQNNYQSNVILLKATRPTRLMSQPTTCR